jgi:branched-chain amino acid transport system substrate-binding protein
VSRGPLFFHDLPERRSIMKKCAAVLFVSFIASLFLADTACLAQTSKVLKIGAPIPLGGVGGAYVGIGWGYNDCEKYINEKGGVKGNKIAFLVEDNRWDVTTEIAIINRLLTMEQKDELLLFCGNLITGTLKAMSEKINKEVQIPSISLSYSVEMFGRAGGPGKYPYYFSTGPDYAQQVGLLLRYIKKDHKKSAGPKLAVAYSPTEYGRDPLADMKEDCKKLGIEIVSEEEMAPTASDVSSQVLNMRKAKPDYIIWHGFLPGMLVAPVFVKTARQYMPGVPILGTHYTTIPAMIAAAGEASEGLIGVNANVMWYESENPFVKLVKEQMEKAGRKVPEAEQSNYIQGWALGLLGAHALEAASAAGALTREGVRKALEGSTWDFNGMYEGKKFSYASHKVPMARIFKASLAEKQFKPISPWLNVDEELK